MITFQFFKKKDTVIIVETKHGRLANVHDVTYLPLFKKYDVRKLQFPTRQQIFSKRHYVATHYTLLQEESKISLKGALEIAKELILKNGDYARNC